MDIVDIVDKVNYLSKEQKITQLKIAQSINIAAPSVSDILKRKGRKFSTEHIPKLARLFGVTEAYLLGSEDIIAVKTIPLIGLASCGVPKEYDLNGYESIPVSADIYRDGMYAVRAEGNSMSPKINDNNLVYCVSNETIDNGHIVHYTVDGKSGIKKYKMNDKGDIISLIPLNSDYDIITIHADDNLNIRMSKVVGVVDTDF